MTPGATPRENAVVPVDEILVGGGWRRGSGEELAVTDPTDGRIIARVHGASVADVDEAVHRGSMAARSGDWRDLLPAQRARYLHAIADRIEGAAEHLAQLQTLNTGKALAETRALVASAAGTFRYFGSVLETVEDVVTPPRGDYLTMSVHEPIGVVGAITPWNSPIASDAQKLAPALAAGNAVLLKPAAWTPLVALALARLIEEAGVPTGLVSVLPGRGEAIGDAIVRHPGVGKVSFTGGTETGRAIGRIAAEKIMPVSLELGGKSPTIVCEDADIDRSVAGVLFGIFSSSGQSCIAGSRLFVHASRYETVVERVVDGASKLRVGPGTDSGTQVGPLVTAEHRDRVARYVELARAEGGTVRCGGRAPADPALAAGSYYLPTVIDGLPHSARVCQEEIFGPVLVALAFTDEDDLVRQANDSAYGLACGLWTEDYRRAWRLARRIEAGTVWINTYKRLSIATPFGGMKHSGIGREKGVQGIRAYMRQKSLYWGLAEELLPWAAD
ncbi:MAG: aldehyde dehydrogenase family protein [Actinophytocola sp.]|nr:aldehyde dehydrogenase family protein [Actinophytocola sp.]